jgi:hypothetical protein
MLEFLNDHSLNLCLWLTHTSPGITGLTVKQKQYYCSPQQAHKKQEAMCEKMSHILCAICWMDPVLT